MRKYFFFFLLIILLIPTISNATSTVLSCSGNAVDSYVDMSFTLKSSAVSYNIAIRTSAETRDINYIDTVIRPQWALGKTDYTGTAYVIISTSTALTLTASAVTCTPYVSPDAVHLNQEVSFITGALTVMAFSLAFFGVQRL